MFKEILNEKEVQEGNKFTKLICKICYEIRKKGFPKHESIIVESS